MEKNSNLVLLGKAIFIQIGKFFGYLWNNKTTVVWIAALSSIALLFFYWGGSYMAWTKEKPRVERSLRKFATEINSFYDQAQPSPVRILDKNGVLIGEFFRKNFRPIRTDNLGNHQVFIWALLSTEDREFYNHSGMNITAVMRALIVNLSRFRIAQGGSTITQQLAKLSLNLGERNLFNKLTEVYATYYIESKYSKDEILSMYLNQIYLGQDNLGVESASRYYFDKPASELSPAEAAMIVGCIPAPSLYNPVENLRIALARQKIVMAEMARNQDPMVRPKNKKITVNFGSLLDESIRRFRKQYNVVSIKEEGKKERFTSLIGDKGYDRNFKLNLAPDFNMDIRRYILDNYIDEELYGREINVHTTLDYEKQKIAETALKEGIESIRKEILALSNPPKNKKGKPLTKPADPKIVKEIAEGMRGSFVSLDPNTGNVEVFVNNLRISTSYRPNRIENSLRQPGSTIKALIYTLAFEKRLVNPSSTVVDEHISFSGYSPKNWYEGYRGEVTVRRAFAQSINTISVKLLKEIGLTYFLDKLGDILSLEPEVVQKRFNRNLSLALGSGELTPMELATIYATIQNGGKRIVPRKILKITDSQSLEDFSFPTVETYQVLDPVACAMALDTIESVLTEEGTMPIRMGKEERFPMGGKTGTVQSPKEARKKWGNIVGVRDAWFSGLIPNASSVVWIGNEWGAPFPGSGSGTTGKVWWKFAHAVVQKNGSSSDSLLTQEIYGSYLKLDICADDGTQLETDWEKEYLEIVRVDTVPTNPAPTSSKSPSMEVEKKKNPKYCKFPLFGQYYYIGDGAERRFIPVENPQPSLSSIPDDTAESEPLEGVSEINKIDIIQKDPNAPGISAPSEPVREGGVELEEPFIDTPGY